LRPISRFPMERDDKGWIIFAAACMVCFKPFATLDRRHHCRDCGSTICGNCSGFKEGGDRICAPRCGNFNYNSLNELDVMLAEGVGMSLFETHCERGEKSHAYDIKYKIVQIFGIVSIKLNQNVFKVLTQVSHHYVQHVLLTSPDLLRWRIVEYWKKYNLKLVAITNNENLTVAHMSAIHNYTLEHYEKVNYALLKDDEMEIKEHAPYIHILRQGILASYQKLPDVVYRKLFLSPEEVDSYKARQHKTICIPSFVSTTANETLLEKWQGNYILKIYLTERSRVCACDVTQYSAYPLEQEILIVPYTWFQVIDVDASCIYLHCKDHTYEDSQVNNPSTCQIQ